MGSLVKMEEDFDNQDIDEGLKVADKKMKNKSEVRGYARSLLSNPQQLADAQAAASNNPQLLRAAQELGAKNKGDCIPLKERKKLQSMAGLKRSSLPTEERLTAKKVVKISRANGKRVQCIFPRIDQFSDIEVLEIFNDVFIIHDKSLKKKNTYASQLTAHANITIFGDAFIYKNVDGQTVDVTVQEVNTLYQMIVKNNK